MTRDERVEIRATTDELAAWCEAAKRDGRSLSSWIRRRLQEHLGIRGVDLDRHGFAVDVCLDSHDVEEAIGREAIRVRRRYGGRKFEPLTIRQADFDLMLRRQAS